MKARKEKKPKIPRIEIAPRKPANGQPADALAVEAYQMLDELIGRWHGRLKKMRIMLAWLRGLKADADDQLRLGKPIRSTDLPRQLSEVDWVIAVNREAFGMFTPAQRRALLDHELCHAAIATSKKSGEPRIDALGRPVFRVRKHDVEEFAEVAKRHGLWKSGLEAFWRAAVESAKVPLFAGKPDEPRETPTKTATRQSHEARRVSAVA